MEPEAKFWRLLADYEGLTRQEAFAISQEDFLSLDAAQVAKSAILPVWNALGEVLGLTRQSSPELNTRLQALAAAALENVRALGAAKDAVLRRQHGAEETSRRLRQVGRNYREEAPVVAADASPGFAACG